MRALLVTTTLLFTSPAMAAQWEVDETQSTLTFEGAQAGTPFKGTFADFTPTIDFDPQHPEKGSIAVTVATASATIADDDEQNEALPTEDWFFVEQFPSAQFTSTSIHTTGKDSFEAKGDLTIRGVKQPVVLPFTLNAEGTATRAKGSLTLDRKLFGLGGKEWADDKWIAYPVTITYSILATPK
jgi:polyisoprenoid-binding protein YceI